jgi:hypothetical protein
MSPLPKIAESSLYAEEGICLLVRPGAQSHTERRSIGTFKLRSLEIKPYR